MQSACSACIVSYPQRWIAMGIELLAQLNLKTDEASNQYYHHEAIANNPH